MRKLSEYDFSKESSLKERLLKKCLSRFSELSAERINDDELKYVAAAGTGDNVKVCPCPQLNCKCCKYYSLNSVNNCTLGCRKRKQETDD